MPVLIIILFLETKIKDPVCFEQDKTSLKMKFYLGLLISFVLCDKQINTTENAASTRKKLGTGSHCTTGSGYYKKLRIRAWPKSPDNHFISIRTLTEYKDSITDFVGDKCCTGKSSELDEWKSNNVYGNYSGEIWYDFRCPYEERGLF